MPGPHRHAGYPTHATAQDLTAVVDPVGDFDLVRISDDQRVAIPEPSALISASWAVGSLSS